MESTVQISINKSFIEQASSLAQQCSSTITRQRVFLTQSVALAMRDYVGRAFHLPTEDGRSNSLRFVELLDICDFQANGWFIDVRINTSLEEDVIHVPTTPLMVGVLSDFYVCARVSPTLTSAEILGYASREDLAEADLTENGLFASLPIEELRTFETLPQQLKQDRPFDPEQLRAFERWQERADLIIKGVSNYLESDGTFDAEQVKLLSAGLKDNILRIYGDHLPESGLEPLFNVLFQRFGLEKPIPAAPGTAVMFSNKAEDRKDLDNARLRDQFFRDKLSVKQRVSLYRYLLEDDSALKEHLISKRVLDRATAGKHQTTSRQRARVQDVRKKRAETLDAPTGTEPPLTTASIEGDQRSQTLQILAKDVDLSYAPDIDFSADPEIVRAVAEGERLTYGHLFNPAFATEISLIDPLPHQRIAAYEHMLEQTRLRFLLADDAGAGKTKMTGLYIREMLSLRLISRVIIVPPEGLVENWEREMHKLISLPFGVITGADAKTENPFIGPESDRLIVSVDTLRGDAMFSRLQEAGVVPYDLVVFDESHKLAADREPDLRLRKTDRYRLAEALAGIPSEDERWGLSWSCQHLLLLTATPHMGKDFPYYCLWRLLEPEALATIDAFNAYPLDARRRHFIRRTKEELVYFDGCPIYPPRFSDTLSYHLNQGEVSEQQLYDATTTYIQTYYNRAHVLNRSAARLAMSVFQRRLASSTYALLRSFERREQKLAQLVEAMRSGKLDVTKLKETQRELDKRGDIFDEKTADEEEAVDEQEENEVAEDQALEGVVPTPLAELEIELAQVTYLCELARKVHEAGSESKFEKLREVLLDPDYKQEKMIIFTEHRDTLESLVRRLDGLGFTGQIAQIHGGMNYQERERQVAHFRKPVEQGGAKYLVATDAAGEGINLQVCWLMVNYDIPWNPARLEQRMGRIHRFGQKHPSVLIMNLVAGKTREGRVMKTLLEKLEKIRKDLGADKVV